jgi:lipopolysaccharide transport protein LptA
MRRPENTINQSPPGRLARQMILVPVLTGVILCATSTLLAGERLSGFSAGDNIAIKAKNAWEDAVPDTIHFSGQFELRAHDWYLSADQATLVGNLDDPETAILTGSPANIQLEIQANDRPETVKGQANRIVYQRATNSISLLGEATLSKGSQTMQGEQIEYDIDTDRIQAGGDHGISIRVEPEN